MNSEYVNTSNFLKSMKSDNKIPFYDAEDLRDFLPASLSLFNELI